MDPAILFLILTTAVKIVVFTFIFTLPIIAYSTYAERRVSSIIQDRVGPNRVGIPLTLFGAKKDIPFSAEFKINLSDPQIAGDYQVKKGLVHFKREVGAIEMGLQRLGCFFQNGGCVLCFVSSPIIY